jgi:hypothetical protein
MMLLKQQQPETFPTSSSTKNINQAKGISPSKVATSNNFYIPVKRTILSLEKADKKIESARSLKSNDSTQTVKKTFNYFNQKST